jgi:predicted phosphohydrolase
MNDHDFTTAFTVPQTPHEAFAAITNVRGWWSQDVEGRTDEPDEEFVYQYKDLHRCRIKVTEAVPGQRLRWLVVDNYFSFTEDKTEWTGTEITFEVSDKGNETEVRFTHRGLTPEYECFDVCSNSWGSYINGSLKRLITTGKGRPNRKETRA